MDIFFERRLKVADSQGCSNSITEYIDWANILSYTVENFRGTFHSSSNSVNLYWETAKKFIPREFKIERALETSLDFTTINTVPSNGFSYSISTYNFEDHQLPRTGGRIYYRIRYQENDYRYNYSEVISLLIPSSFNQQSWQVYPNPVQNEDLILRSSGPISFQPMLIQLLSSKGERVQLTVDQPFTEINLTPHMQSFSKGLITVHLAQEGAQQTIKVWKR